MEQTTISPECIGIVGLGLIGGSLALDLQSLGFEVHGLVHKDKTADKARKRQLAQVISTNPKILADCELIILALPLNQLLKPSQSLINALPESAIVTDVGSVKAPVLKVWRSLHQRFVASHPMAGTNDAGVDAGRRELFKQRPWVATPENNTNPEALAKVKQLALSLGSQWITTQADLHDQAVALVSHLPVLISAALLKTVKDENSSSVAALAKSLASSGFADTTRVGGGNPKLGTSMMATNTSAILQALASYRGTLEQLEQIILAQQWAQLQTNFEQTQAIRPDFLKEDL